MKTSIIAIFAAFSLSTAVVAPAVAQTSYDQLAASAGLGQAEAAGMTRAQIAAYFFNRGESIADRQTVPQASLDPMSLSSRNGPNADLRALAAEINNRGVSNADKIVLTTLIPGMSADRSQLAASAGLGINGAEGRDLSEIAAIFFNRGESLADRQTIPN